MHTCTYIYIPSHTYTHGWALPAFLQAANALTSSNTTTASGSANAAELAAECAEQAPPTPPNTAMQPTAAMHLVPLLVSSGVTGSVGCVCRM